MYFEYFGMQVMEKKRKPRLLGRQCWCVDCLEKAPPKIVRADYLIPARNTYYWTNESDLKLVGICKECLKNKNEFQKSNTQQVDVDHPHLKRLHCGF